MVPGSHAAGGGASLAWGAGAAGGQRVGKAASMWPGSRPEWSAAVQRGLSLPLSRSPLGRSPPSDGQLQGLPPGYPRGLASLPVSEAGGSGRLSHAVAFHVPGVHSACLHAGLPRHLLQGSHSGLTSACSPGWNTLPTGRRCHPMLRGRNAPLGSA